MKNLHSKKTSIESIIIPNEVRIIGKRAFYECKQLQYIEISEESKLQTIEEFAFSDSEIKSITIQSSTTNLKKSGILLHHNYIKLN